MRQKFGAVALAVLLALAGCSAIDINRPADDAANATDASGGAGAPTGEDGSGDDTDGTDTEQAADAATPTATEGPATAEPTATPVTNVLRLANDGEQDYVVSVTVTNDPVEAVKLVRADDSTDVVVLDGRSLDDVLTADTVDVRPIEVVEASQEYEVDAGESVTETLPGDERRHALVEVRTDDEETTVVGGAVLACRAGETVGEVSVTVDGDATDVTSQCVD